MYAKEEIRAEADKLKLLPGMTYRAALKEAQESRKAALADQLGLPEGWLVIHRGMAKHYRSPDGKVYTSLKELRDSSALDIDLINTLQRADEKSKGRMDASEFGFPEGWTCKIYAKAKTFFSPEGDRYENLKSAMEALKASQGEMEEDDPTQAIRARLRKRKASQEHGDDAKTHRFSDKAITSSRKDSTTPQPGGPDITDTSLPSPDLGYNIQENSAGTEWTVVPDDVVWVDLEIIGRNLEAAGWALKSDFCPRVFEKRSDGSLLTLFTCGKMLISGSTKQSAHCIASSFVNDWLVNA